MAEPQSARAAYDPQQHRILQEAAFKRGAGESDLAALYAFELSMELADTAPPATELQSTPPMDAAPSESPAATSPAPYWTRWRRAGASIAIMAALSVGATGAWAWLALAEVPSLRVFETPSSEPSSDLVAGMLEHLGAPGAAWQERLLGEFDGTRVFGILGTVDVGRGGEPRAWATGVCLFVDEGDGSGGGSCVPYEEFMVDGIEIGMSETEMIRWGPSGGVTRTG